MRPLIPALLVILGCEPALPVPGSGAQKGRAAVLVRVATWNVHDLFDAEDRLVPPGDRDEVPSAAEVEARLGALAAVLARADADLVFLQEVENGSVLDRLAAMAGYPDARLVEGNDPRGIDVAVLSRLALQAYVSHRGDLAPDGRLLWPRDCVEVHAEVDGARLVLVGSHLSSALSDDGTRRAWQAARLRALADGLRQAHPAALVVAGGDLNDVPDAASLAPLLEDGWWLDGAPRGATWTGSGRAEHLDYLLVHRAASAALVRAEILDADLASDHRPVVAELLLE
jgi:endonuclease/exonuclease/phosphatase family metal-dependent hydrolase